MVHESGRELKFDLEDLYATAPAFKRAGGELEDAVQLAKRQLEGLGNFWGDDDPGHTFGATYQPHQERLLQLLAMVANEVEGVGDGIVKMADKFGVAEDDNVSKIQSLSEEK